MEEFVKGFSTTLLMCIIVIVLIGGVILIKHILIIKGITVRIVLFSIWVSFIGGLFYYIKQKFFNNKIEKEMK